MPFVDLIAAAAAVLTTVSFLPQALRVIATRDTRSISLSMYGLFVAGVALWGVYGFLTAQPAILIANLVTFLLAGVILGFKVGAVLSRPLSSAGAGGQDERHGGDPTHRGL
jgi:MtN3 and saliva related transmembrane protein